MSKDSTGHKTFQKLYNHLISKDKMDLLKKIIAVARIHFGWKNIFRWYVTYSIAICYKHCISKLHIKILYTKLNTLSRYRGFNARMWICNKKVYRTNSKLTICLSNMFLQKFQNPKMSLFLSFCLLYHFFLFECPFCLFIGRLFPTSKVKRTWTKKT